MGSCVRINEEKESHMNHCNSTDLHFSKRSHSGFGGLEVVCWSLVPKFAGSNPAEAVGFFRAKKSSARFLRRGSKAVCPMS